MNIQNGFPVSSTVQSCCKEQTETLSTESSSSSKKFLADNFFHENTHQMTAECEFEIRHERRLETISGEPKLSES